MTSEEIIFKKIENAKNEQSKRKFVKALKYLQETEKYAKDTNRIDLLSIMYGIIGEISTRLNRYENALHFYKLCLYVV